MNRLLSGCGAFVWIDHLFDPANVVDVYGTTGRPDDDGRPASSDGRQVASNFGALERTCREYDGYRVANPIFTEFCGSYGSV